MASGARKTKVKIAIGLLVALGVRSAAADGGAGEYEAGDDWPHYNGNSAGTHYSRLSDINTNNVNQLRIAWEYDTHDKLSSNSTMEANPLIVSGNLFFVSPGGRVISLHGATGKERWVFTPAQISAGFRRGVSYWNDGTDQRILYIFGTSLYAIDAQSGRLIEGFGEQGRVALGSSSTSPGALYKDLYIIGGSASSIRAFDVRTGKLRWTFHTIPRPGEFGYETWPKEAWKTAIGANNWPGMVVDVARGMAFVSLAFPQSYYGADRTGDNLFANCVVALDAMTGRRVWHFQAIRHDLWDRDLAAPPTLVTVTHNGRTVDAVAQISKHGFVFVLDRITGKSLFPLAEKLALGSDVPGEIVAKSQIEPLLPEPFARQHLTPDLLTKRTPAAASSVRAEFAKLRSRGLWDPPSEQGTVMLPGMDGGGEWGGAAYDPASRLLFINSNEMPWILRLKKVSEGDVSTGGAVYREYCAGCHGTDRAGNPPEFPSLVHISDRMGFYEISQKIAAGGGRMPAFRLLANDQVRLWSLVSYLQTGVDTPNRESLPKKSRVTVEREQYVLDGMPRFVDPDGYPAITPPWGTLNAIDLNTGRYAWKIPFGEYPELVAQGLKDTGSENYGGPIVTAGGLLFIGATSFDRKFRAYDKHTGALLWETLLPAAGNATPSTYRANGRQFVVIAAGGGRPPTAQSGSKILSFALPK